ncbi:glycine zipper domain-containing protein [Aminobacter sp. BA135]
MALGANSQPEKGTAVGGQGGAAIGAAVANDPVQGAVVGGADCAVAGALIGRANEPDRCPYRDRYGKCMRKSLVGRQRCSLTGRRWPVTRC